MDVDEFMAGRVAAKALRRQRHAVAALQRAGSIAKVLPGTFVRAEDVTRPVALAHAICAYDPRAVLNGHAAAALQLRPGAWPQVLTFTSPGRWTITRPWFLHTLGRWIRSTCGLGPSRTRSRP